VLQVKFLAILHKWPNLLLKTEELNSLFEEHMPNSKYELLLCYCWVIGEYISSMKVTDSELITKFDESLETLAYESISEIKNSKFPEISKSSSKMLNPSNENTFPNYVDPVDPTFNTRLFLILIGAISKLAAKWQPLIPRAMFCLSAIIKCPSIDGIVHSRASDCKSLLKFPSIAESILTSAHKTGPKLTHIDQNSSLLFMNITNVENRNYIHEFFPDFVQK